MICEICGSDIVITFWGPVGEGVCRFDRDPNQEDQGQHVAIYYLGY